jgi:GH25 family lysozyme M1 (1,4-beta-N-acetylmuramidase)
VLFYHQVKQRLENNLLYGANERDRSAYTFAKSLYTTEESYAQFVAGALIEPDYNNKVWGIDVSHWDWLVDLQVTKDKGGQFVFIKGIDGTLRTKYFPENRSTALSVGLPHAPYGWLYANRNISCKAQAQAYNNLVQDYPPVLTPVIDFEWTYYGGLRSDPNYSDLRLWVDEWLRLGNPKPILYSAAGYMNTFGQIPSDLKDKFEGLWVANYGVLQPIMPLGYAPDEWLYHQFTSSGNQLLLAPSSANKKELDLNYQNVGYIPPQPGEPMYLEATGNITMRTGAASSYPNATLNGVAQYVLKGDIAEVSETQNGFAHLVKLWRNNVLVEVPPDPVWFGTYWTKVVTFNPPDNPPPTPIGDIHAELDFKDDGTVAGTWSKL